MNILTSHFILDDSRNSLHFSYNLEKLPEYYYNMIITDNKNSLYYSRNIDSSGYFVFIYEKVFNYNIKIVLFNGVDTKIISEKKFNIKDHVFNINLKSQNEDELKIWKDYLSSVELKLEVKFKITTDNIFSKFEETEDYVEISKDRYDNFLKQTSNSLSADYSSSSLNVIKNLFDVFDY